MNTQPIAGRGRLHPWLFTLAFVLMWVAQTSLSHAAPTPTLTVSQTSGLNPAGQFVSISGAGFDPGLELFVLQCSATSAQDHTCNSIGMQKVTTDATGAFRSNPMRVVARFGATDCQQVQCAIKTSAVANHSENRSDDLSVNISFGSGTTPPTSAAAPATTAPVAPTTLPSTTPPNSEPDVSTTTSTTSTTAPPSSTLPATTTAAPITSALDDSAAPGDSDGSSIGLWVISAAVLLGAGGLAAFLFTRRSPNQKDSH